MEIPAPVVLFLLLATCVLARPDIGLDLRGHQKPLSSYGVPSASVTNPPVFSSSYLPPPTPSPTYETPLVSSPVPFYTGLPLVTPTFAPILSQGFGGLDTGIPQFSSQGTSFIDQSSQLVYSPSSQPAQVQKHVYFFEAPEEPEDVKQYNVPVTPPKKNVKIIFIKAPTYQPPPPPIVPVPPQNEEKTLVYVLVKKPDPAELIVPTQPPLPPAKPEVFFIKYKNQKEAEDKVSNTLTEHANSGANIITNTGLDAGLTHNVITGDGGLSYTDSSLLGAGLGYTASPLLNGLGVTVTGNGLLGGGWYIMKNWNLMDFDAKNLLKDLHVKYGVTPFFKVTVDPNPSSPGNSSIRISPSGLGLPDRRYYYSSPGNPEDPIQTAYIQLIRDVVINFSATRREAVIFGKDIFYYEKRIAEITPESNELEDPVRTYNIVKVSELQITAPNLYFYDILTAMFPEANINEDTEVILTSQDYLSKVSQIVSTTDSTTMNSYMMWTLVKTYLPYLSLKFTSAWNSYNSELLGFQKPVERWEFCTNLLRKFMGFAVDLLLEKQQPLSDTTKSVVAEIFRSVRKTVEKRLEKFRTTPGLHKHLIRKIRSITLQIALPPETTNDEYVKNYYKKLTVIKSTFFGNYKNGVLFLKKLEERRLVSHHPEDYSLIYANQRLPNVRYLPSANVVIIPRALLTAPYFEERYPRAVLYGRLGVDVSNAVVSSVLPYGSAWTSDWKLLTEFHAVVNESLRDVQYPRRCLSEFMVAKNLCVQELASLTTLSTLKLLSALGLGEEALNVVDGEANHVHQPSLEIYEDSALYYLTFAQSLCSVSSQQHKTYDSITKYKLADESLLQVAWHHVPGFPESVDCPFDSEAVCSDIF